MAELAARKQTLENALQDPALYETPSQRPAELTRQLGETNAELGQVEEAWLIAQENLEQAAVD